MTVSQLIAERARRRGITFAELSRRCGIDAELLRRSLVGTRRLHADEFVAICAELEMSLSDFEACKVAGKH